MKAESLKELKNITEAIELAMTETNACNNIERFIYVIDTIARIIMIENEDKPRRNAKFNIFNYTMKPDPRTDWQSTLTGVYHDNGLRVASDSHILIVKKEDYPAEYEGKMVAKNGTFVKITNDIHRYPNYKLLHIDVATAQRDGKPYVERRVDFDLLNRYKKEREALKKAQKKDSIEPVIKLGDVYLKFDLFWLLAEFMKEIGSETIWTCGEEAMVQTECGESYGCLVPFNYHSDSIVIPKKVFEL